MDERERERLQEDLEYYLDHKVVFLATQQKLQRLSAEPVVKEYLQTLKNFQQLEEETSYAFRDVSNRVKCPTLVTDKHGKTFVVTPTDVIEVMV